MIKIDKSIPHTMTLAGLEYLGRMARSVPENGLIVEVGPLFGSSTWVLAQNSHPSVRVISIDTWERMPWIEEIEKKFPGCVRFSREAFEHYTRDCPNVEAVQGWSPEVIRDRDLAGIDLFFDDATHGDPGFSESLNYYVPRVRPGGIVCGDDYAGGWPDIVRGVDRLAESWNRQAEVCGRVWSLVKPEAEGGTAPSVASLLDYEPETVRASVGTVNADGVLRTASPLCWAGQLHKPVPLTCVSVGLPEGPSELAEALAIQARFADGSVSKERPAREGVAAPTAGSIASLRLIAQGDAPYEVRYQGCQMRDRPGKTRTVNTKEFRDGAWIDVEPGSLLCAVRVDIRSK